jgi:signal recognition particle receptor subunit beta
VVQFDFENRVINVKLVLCGVPMAGKTTHLLEAFVARADPGDLLEPPTSIALEGDRMLFLSHSYGTLGKLAVHVQLYTVPGAIDYRATVKLSLQGADGLLLLYRAERDAFDRQEADEVRFREELAEMCEDHEQLLADAVVLWTHLDRPEACSLAELEARFNPTGRPSVESVCGSAMWPAYEDLMPRVLRRIQERYGLSDWSSTVGGVS